MWRHLTHARIIILEQNQEVSNLVGCLALFLSTMVEMVGNIHTMSLGGGVAYIDISPTGLLEQVWFVVWNLAYDSLEEKPYALVSHKCVLAFRMLEKKLGERVLWPQGILKALWLGFIFT